MPDSQIKNMPTDMQISWQYFSKETQFAEIEIYVVLSHLENLNNIS